MCCHYRPTRKMKTRNFDCCGATWRKMIFHQNWGRRLPSFCNINIPCGKKPGRHGNQRGKTQVDYGTGWFCWEDETFPVKGLISVEVVFFGGSFWCSALLQKSEMHNFGGNSPVPTKNPKERGTRWSCVFFFGLEVSKLEVFADIVTP